MAALIIRVLLAITISVVTIGVISLFPALRRRIEYAPFERYAYPPQASSVEVMYTKGNGGLSWASTVITVDGEVIKVRYPIWSCWVLFRYPDLLADLGREFLEKFGDSLTDTRICAISAPAFYFLMLLEDQLQRLGVDIFGIDPRYSNEGLPQNWQRSKLVLFDLNLNTGRTMHKARKVFRQAHWEPTSYIVAFFNDLVPKVDRVPEEGWEDIIDYIYRASLVIHHWEDEQLVADTEIVQDALAEKRSWKEKRVQEGQARLNKLPGGAFIIQTHPVR